MLERCGPHNSSLPVSAGSGSSSKRTGQLGLFKKSYIPEACRRKSEEVTVLPEPSDCQQSLTWRTPQAKGPSSHLSHAHSAISLPYGSIEADLFPSGALPPINYLDIEKIKRESAVYNHNGPVTSTVQMSAPPLVSPSSMYSGPPPPYSYPSSAASSAIGDGRGGPGIAPGNYMSPPETRRSSDEKEPPASQRQSLPSINEALNTGEQQPISISSLLSTSAPSHKITLVTKSPTSPVNRPFLDSLPKGPPDFFPQHTVSLNHRPQEQPEQSTRPIYSPGVVTSHGESRFPTINSLSTARSYDSFHTSKQPTTAPPPTDYSRPGASPIQNNPGSSPSTETHSRSVAATTAPYGYSTYQPAYAYPPSSASGIPSYRRPTAHQPTWRGMGGDLDRPEEMRRATKESPPPRPAYGESVKRHLDIYDLETSLNDVSIFHCPFIITGV